jgi:uncharacterized protein YlxP (DUF503 family)
MIIGACELQLHLPEVASLKEKRSVLKSLLARLRNKFNVSAAEVGHNDLWQSAVIGIVTVSNSTVHVNQMLTQVMNWIESSYPQIMITDQSIEIL